MEIRRKVKNVVYKYSEPERLVREATSNDPWGPTSTVMSEIADLTYDYVAFEAIMPLIWKRLNDKGKNWRHVYKSLVLLDYLIKCGDQRVANICNDNIHAITTLKDFQYFEEHKDLGLSVREKSKTLVTLLRDDELLNLEREKGQKVKEKFQSNQTAIRSHQKRKPGDLGREIRRLHGKDSQHPNNVMKLNFDETRNENEEDDLRKAIQLSKEDHENTLKKKYEEERLESLKLKIALEQSEEEALSVLRPPPKVIIPTIPLNLLNISTTDTIERQIIQQSKAAPKAKLCDVSGFGDPLNVDKFDLWATSTVDKNGNDINTITDPWMSNLTVSEPSKTEQSWSDQRVFQKKNIIDEIFGDDKPNIDFNDSWCQSEKDDPRASDVMNMIWCQPSMDVIHGQSNTVTGSLGSLDHLSISGGDLIHHSASATNVHNIVAKKSAQDFLGDNAKLVNLDQLLPTPTAGVYLDRSSYSQKNPFGNGPSVNGSNPFSAVQDKTPMNQNMAYAQAGNLNAINNNHFKQSMQSFNGATQSQYPVHINNAHFSQWPQQSHITPQYNAVSTHMHSSTMNPFM